MERKDFLKAAGAIGITSVLPLRSAASTASRLASANVCTLIPTETAGPYPLNLSGNPGMFRQDIREAQDGVDLRVKLKLFGINNCIAMENLRIDIWHCNAHGYYSGYTTNGQQGSQNHVGETWLRGIQITDVNGEVEFLTKFPGWYSGRTTHIHFQVYLNSILQATSQFTFPIVERDALFTSNLPYSNYGPDPTNPTNDNVFSDGYSTQLGTLTFNSGTNEYETYFEIGINGSGSVGLLEVEPETGGQFKLGQNFPNPFDIETAIPFLLNFPSDVRLEIYGLDGRQAAVIHRGLLDAGEHTITINLKELGISRANYAYQLVVSNKVGSYSQVKLMSHK